MDSYHIRDAFGIIFGIACKIYTSIKEGNQITCIDDLKKIRGVGPKTIKLISEKSINFLTNKHVACPKKIIKLKEYLF